MEIENLKFKVVMEDGADTEVLARLAHLDIGAAAYMAAVARFPKRNVQLRHGGRIIKRHDGEPKPPSAAPDPALPDWDVNLIRGAKLDFMGTVMAADRTAATAAAIERFRLTAEQIKRLAINPRW